MSTVEPRPLSVDDRTALAVLVAHPTSSRPFRLDADNQHAGQLPGIADAVATDAAYVVTVAPDVVAIDADDPASLDALDVLATELAADGWPVLRLDSGRAGHRHLWAVVTDLDALDRATFRAVTLGLPISRPTMRPPGTPHRSGLPVHLVDDPDAFRADVARLRAADAVPAPARFDWRDLLATGRLPDSLASIPDGVGPGWWLAHWIATGVARDGLTLDALRCLLADPKNRGGAAYRRRLTRKGKNHADHWLDRYVWPKATEAARHRATPPADATEARSRLDALADAMHAHRWTGQAGATDRAVLAALVARARQLGTLTPNMSHRQLAEAAPCHRRTIVRSVPRLVAAGWLQTVERGRGRTVTVDGQHQERADATTWRLRIPAELDPARLVTTGGTPPARTSLGGDTSRGQTARGTDLSASRSLLDACRWRGVGLNAPRVLDALAAGDLTTVALADRLQLNRGNLRYRLLPRLAAFGLIVGAGDRWQLPDDLDAALEAAAEVLELTGKADAVAEHHATERAKYLEWREETRPDRAANVAASMAAKRRTVAEHHATTQTGRLPWPEQAPQSSETPALAPPLVLDPLPPPDPVEAALAPLSGSGGGHGD